MVFTVNLERIEDLIEETVEQETNDKMKKFGRLFDDIKAYMKKQKIILYGGTAMDLHLPKESKIYSDKDFPDYDAFSVNPKKDAEAIAKRLTKLNYKYIEIKHAVHDGTYKLYVDFEAIIDLTKVSVENHRILFKNSSEIDGFFVTSIKHLKSAAYLELAIPKSSLFRWQKVVDRIKLMETEFKNNKSAYSPKSIQHITFSKKINDVVEKMFEHAITNGLPVAGNHAIEFYLNDFELPNKRLDKFMLTNSSGVFQFMSTSVEKDVDKMEKILQKSGFKKIVVKTFKNDFIIPYTKLYVEYFDDKYTFERIKLNVCTVYDANEHCFSFKHDSTLDVKFTSIFFLLHILYFNLFKREDRIDKTNSKNIINRLSKKININHFQTQCYGIEMTMNEIRRRRWDENKKVTILRMA